MDKTQISVETAALNLDDRIRAAARQLWEEEGGQKVWLKRIGGAPVK